LKEGKEVEMPNEWQSVLDEISNNVSEMAFNVYFTNFNLVSNEDGVITVSVPNSMIKNSIEKKFLSAVEGALEANHIKYDKINIFSMGFTENWYDLLKTSL